ARVVDLQRVVVDLREAVVRIFALRAVLLERQRRAVHRDGARLGVGLRVHRLRELIARARDSEGHLERDAARTGRPACTGVDDRRGELVRAILEEQPGLRLGKVGRLLSRRDLGALRDEERAYPAIVLRRAVLARRVRLRLALAGG